MRFVIIALLPTLLFSHALKAFITQEESHMKIKSYFTASSPCKGCKVTVKTHNYLFLVYKTNDKGEAFIPLDVKPVSVIIEGSLGHQVEKKLSLEYDETPSKEQPVWLKIIIAIFIFSLFFIGLRWIKKR